MKLYILIINLRNVAFRIRSPSKMFFSVLFFLLPTVTIWDCWFANHKKKPFSMWWWHSIFYIIVFLFIIWTQVTIYIFGYIIYLYFENDDDIFLFIYIFILSCWVETVPWSNFQESSSCSLDEEGIHLRCSDRRGTARFAASGVSISTDPLCKKRVSGVFWGASVRVSCLFGRQLNQILSSPCGRCTN